MFAWLKQLIQTESDRDRVERQLASLTPRARRVLHSARQEADRRQHRTLDTGHLLLALLGLGQGVAIDILRKMGAKQGALRIELEKALAQAEAGSPSADSARSPAVTMVLARASQEAQILHHAYVGTEHLLLALLRDDAGQAGRVLRSMGIDVEMARVAVLQELCPTWSDADRAETAPINLTLRAQQVLALARQEAVRLRDDSIRTEHVLFGLLRLKQGVAIRVLGRMGVLVDAVQREVTRLLGTPKDAPIPDDPPYDAVVKLVLASASQEAKAMHRSCVGTEHILLGLLRRGSGPIGGLLQVLELEVDETRRAILKGLEPSRRAE